MANEVAGSRSDKRVSKVAFPSAKPIQINNSDNAKDLSYFLYERPKITSGALEKDLAKDKYAKNGPDIAKDLSFTLYDKKTIDRPVSNIEATDISKDKYAKNKPDMAKDITFR